MKSMDDVKEKLSRGLNGGQAGNMIFPPNMREFFTNVITLVLQHFSEWENGKDIVLKEEPDKIINTLRQSNSNLFAFLSETPMMDDLKEFLESYTILLTNWAYNIKEQSNLNMNNVADEIIQSMRALNRILEMQYTMLELINSSKFVIKFMKRLRYQYTPSIELSKHYLATMDEEINGIDSTEKEDKCDSCDEKCTTKKEKDKLSETNKKKKELIWKNKV